MTASQAPKRRGRTGPSSEAASSAATSSAGAPPVGTPSGSVTVGVGDVSVDVIGGWRRPAPLQPGGRPSHDPSRTDYAPGDLTGTWPAELWTRWSPAKSPRVGCGERCGVLGR